MDRIDLDQITRVCWWRDTFWPTNRIGPWIAQFSLDDAVRFPNLAAVLQIGENASNRGDGQDVPGGSNEPLEDFLALAATGF